MTPDELLRSVSSEPATAEFADQYAARPGWCNYTRVPHKASRVYALDNERYFLPEVRICEVHLYIKCNMATWPKNFFGSVNALSVITNRPLPLEMVERGQAKKSPDNPPAP